MYRKIHNKITNKIAFTLVELIVVIVIITLLASIVVIVLNPQSILANSRNSQRSHDLSTIQNSFARYLAEAKVNGPQRSIADLAGYSSLYQNAIGGISGNCANGINGQNLNVSGIFSLDTSGSNFIDVSPLINNGYLPRVPKDPSGNTYQACIDTANNNYLVIFAPQTENNSNKLATVLNVSSAVSPPPTYVQTVSKQSNDCTTSGVFTVNFSSPVTAGNLLAVALQTYPSYITSITDNLGNTYALAAKDFSSANDITEVWYAKNIVGGTPTLSLNFSQDGYCTSVIVQEYSNLSKTSPVDRVQTNKLSSNIPDSGLTDTTTSNNEVLFGAFGNYGGCANLTPASGFTLRKQYTCDTPSATSLYAIDKIVNTSGSYNASGTFDQSVAWTAIIVTFKVSGGAVAVNYGSSPAYVQSYFSKTQDCNQNSPFTITFTNPVTAGNLLVLGIENYPNAVTSITDNLGNTYTQAVSQNSGMNDVTSIWYAKNITGGTPTISLNFTGTTCVSVAAFEYTNLSTTSPLDKTHSATGNSSSFNSGNTVTTTSANELIFGAATNTGTCASVTPAAGFTLRKQNICDGPTVALYTMDKFVSVTGTYNASGTFSTSVVWNGVVATFK